MKKMITCLVALAVSATLAFGEGSTDFKQVGDLTVKQLHVGTLDGSSILLPWSKFVAATPVQTIAPAYDVVSTALWSNGTWRVVTNSFGPVTNANLNTLGPKEYFGKAGCYVVAATNALTLYAAAPGTTLRYVVPAHTNISSGLWSNGLYRVTTNVVAAETVLVPGASVGQKFTIVNGGTESFTLASGTTILPAAQSVTVAANSAVTLTAVSGSYWQLFDAGHVAGVNALATGTPVTNTCIAQNGKTNTYVFVPFGANYIVKSIATSP